MKRLEQALVEEAERMQAKLPELHYQAILPAIYEAQKHYIADKIIESAFGITLKPEDRRS
jgi:hypothetical protein